MTFKSTILAGLFALAMAAPFAATPASAAPLHKDPAPMSRHIATGRDRLAPMLRHGHFRHHMGRWELRHGGRELRK